MTIARDRQHRSAEDKDAARADGQTVVNSRRSPVSETFGIGLERTRSIRGAEHRAKS